MKKSFLLFCVCCLVFDVYTKAQTYAFDTLDINNVRAVFNSVGINFSNQYNSFFEVPKGSGNKTISCNTLWLGGFDINSQTKISGGITSSVGKDYYPGPLTTDGTASIDSATMSQYNKVWKVTKQEIDNHRDHYGAVGYVCPPDILNWPAHGNTTLNQAMYLAPFFDMNEDNVYNPYDGDYPLIRGDEALFFIFNDRGGIHNATGGLSTGIEVQAMAYAFDCPADSALNNAIFINYKIINRSTYRLIDFRIGLYGDMNIGNAQNDYTLSDIKRGSFYTYSGTNSDPVFGNLFPAQACTILSGLYMDADGIDNLKYDLLNPMNNCNEAINGQNFGDSIVDNERYGMTGFISFNDTGSLSAITEPVGTNDYLYYLHCKWKDYTPMRYWGRGHIAAGGYGPPCKFLFPGNSDPCNWGTNGVGPGLPYPTQNWTEEQAGNPSGNRQGLACTGPITLEPGAENYLDVAFIYGVDYTQPNNLLGWQTVLNQRIDSIRNYFINDHTPCGSSISRIDHAEKDASGLAIILYPNPASTTLNIDGLMQNAVAEVYDISGKLLLSKKLNTKQIDISNLAKGFYIIKLSNGEGSMVKKFVKE